MSGVSMYAFAGLVDESGAFRSTLSLTFSEKNGPQGKPLFLSRMQQSLLDQQASFTEQFEHILHFKVQCTLNRWIQQWNTRYMVDDPMERTLQSQQAYETILQRSIRDGANINLDALRITRPFEETEPYIQGRQWIASLRKPVAPTADHTPPRPFFHEPEISVSQVLLFQRNKILRRYERSYDKKLRTWEKIVDKIAQNLEDRKKKYQEDLRKHEEQVQGIETDLVQKKEAYEALIHQHNEQVDQLEALYHEGRKEAVEGYFDLLLWQSPYPDAFPIQTSLDFNPETRVLDIQYTLPHPDSILRTVVPESGEKNAKAALQVLTDEAFGKRYNEIVHKIMIRVHHELYQADSAQALSGIRLNGVVQYLNKANGQVEKICIARLHSTRQGFDQLNLSRIDPSMCFRFLGGEGGHDLSLLESVDELGLKPIMGSRRMLMERAPVASAKGLLDSEHTEQALIEIFEESFQMQHGTLELIRRRGDGLIEYMGKDPNPITGGDFILHVKTGTQPISITEARELFAAVVSENAIRGILVAQGELTEDAQDFMRNKPLFMLNGRKLKLLLAKAE